MIANVVKALCGILAILVMSGVAFAQAETSTDAGFAWPTETWGVGEVAGDAAVQVPQLIDDAFRIQRSERMGETRAVVVVHGGEIVFERYADGFDQDTRQISWSMAKSVNQALLGVAVQEGIVPDIDAPMPSAYPEGHTRSNVTWRQWIEMTDGMAWKEVQALSLTGNNAVQMLAGAGRLDVIDYIIDQEFLRPPGRHWNYNTGSTILVGEALAHQLVDDPSPATVKARYDDLFFDRIGMDFVVEFDAAGTPITGALMWATPRDWAKFGLLYLRGGVWDGEQVLPEGWVDWAQTGSETDDGNVYGAGFWRMVPANEASHAERSPDDGPWDAYAVQGSEGQVVWIVPSRDLVIVRMGVMANERSNWTALMNWCQAIARAFPEGTAS